LGLSLTFLQIDRWSVHSAWVLHERAYWIGLMSWTVGAFWTLRLGLLSLRRRFVHSTKVPAHQWDVILSLLLGASAFYFVVQLMRDVELQPIRLGGICLTLLSTLVITRMNVQLKLMRSVA
jgi:hypothetical protein